MTVNWNGHEPIERQPVSFKSLGKWERSATPQGFAEYLIDQVKPHAVLWVSIPTVYTKFRGLELYNIERDAHTYDGPATNHRPSAMRTVGTAQRTMFLGR